MKVLKWRLAALLLIGVTSSPLWAQRGQSQPAQPPPTDEVVQKFLDAPVWYLSWRMSLVCNASGDGGTATLRHVRNGSAELGIRSQGPSLSILNMDPAQMEPRAFLDLIPKYANWIAGPLITDEMTPAEQDAAWTRVMEANKDAFGRYHFSSQDPDSRTRMEGDGAIVDFADYHFEIDAVNKKYKFKPSSGFGDSAQNPAPVVGERVDNPGTVNEVHHPIEYGLEGGGTSMQLVSADPELGFLEGNLPGSFGNISGSPSSAVVVKAHGKELRGTLMIQYCLSPTPPEPVELVIIPPAKLPDWRPTGAEDEKTRGDFVPVKVKLQKVGGGDPQFKANRFVYRLKSSKERGVCMNWPPTPEADSPFDFQFEQELNADYDLIGMDRQIAEQFGDDMTEGQVNVSCFDYGAYGELEVIAVLDNYTEVHGVVQGTQSQRVLKLPLRAADSLIAQAFLKNLPNPKDDDDDETEPVGDAFPGDGLSLYEEYRGFKVGDFWTHADPEKKDVFVLNQMRSTPEVKSGIKVFESATGLKVHWELKDNQVNADMEINFWFTNGPRVVDQHVIRIQEGVTVAQASRAGMRYGPRVKNRGTPGTAESVYIPSDLTQFFLVGRRQVPFLARSVAHEMLHACNVYHHGEADETVHWVYVANPAPHIVERSLRGDTPITVKREDGTVIATGTLFPDPARVSVLEGVWIGVPHGQHSGDTGCLMRYQMSNAYVSTSDPTVRYVTREVREAGLCQTAAGTGTNASNHRPQSRFGTAATTANGGQGILLDRGKCKHQIRVNDKDQEPVR